MLEERDAPRPDVTSDPKLRVDEEAVLRCVDCGHVVTRVRDRIERFGAHTHDRVNPAGVFFRIGCFARADGARGVGEEESLFAWFPRHLWQIVVCGGCGAHLGWRFCEAPSAPFWGLVLDQLRAG